MELRQLRYFQKVAELNSITLAARHFSIPQPSMSQTIARLESELNTKLFDRQNGKLYLNEYGQKFLKHVEQALLELDNAMVSVADTAGEISGSVKLKVTESHHQILSCIPRFAQRYPDVSISLSQGYYEDPEITYDLFVSSRLYKKRMNAHHPLTREKVVLALRKDHPLAQRETVGIADLRGERLISLPPQSTLHAITLERCRAAGFEPHISIVCDDPYFIRKYVDEGMGIALTPSLSWKKRFRENTVLIPLEDPVFLSSYLLWDDSRIPSPAVRRFREYLLEEATRLSEEPLS